MTTDTQNQQLSGIRRLQQIGVPELAEQFTKARSDLKRMIAVRLDTRLKGRADASDIVQDVFIEASRRLPEYLAAPQVKPDHWLRQVGRQILAVHYRQHLGTAKRTVERETRLNCGTAADAEQTDFDCSAPAASPASAIANADLLEQLMQLMESMAPADREIISLKQLQQLSFSDVATELDISVVAAKKRYQRAVVKLGQLARHLNSRSLP